MNKLKIFLLFILFFSFIQNSYAETIGIKVKIQNEIITNLDIENEIKYLIFLNPKLSKLEPIRLDNLAKNSLITEIIKKNELQKFFDFGKNKNLINAIENNLLQKKNIKNVNDFKKILKKQKIEYDNVKKKLLIEALWNRLIYEKYFKNVVIDKDEMRKNILQKFNKKEKKYIYNLSEIMFSESADEKLEQKLIEINKSIKKNGFENTANIYSISNNSKNGGLIGWINELQISSQINNKINKLRVGEISEPIQIKNGFILIKVNDKKQFKQNINVEKELEKLSKSEINRQLNNFSTIFYKRLKRNIEINEY